MTILQFETYSDSHIYLQIDTSGAARGKFVSGAKVLAAMPKCLAAKKNRLETGGEAVVNKDWNTEF